VVTAVDVNLAAQVSPDQLQGLITNMVNQTTQVINQQAQLSQGAGQESS